MTDVDAPVSAASPEEVVIRVFKQGHRNEDGPDPFFRSITSGPREKRQPEEYCMLNLCPGFE